MAKIVVVIIVVAFVTGWVAHWMTVKLYPRREDQLLKEYLRREYGRKTDSDN